MRRIYLLLSVTFIFANLSHAQLTGTKNIPGDYSTLANAIAALNAQGVGAGGVTLNLIASNPQTAPAGGYVIGGGGSSLLTTTSAANPVVIQGNGNTITASGGQNSGSLTDAIFKLVGADWVTITGFTMKENAGNTTTSAGSNNMTEWGVALLHVTKTDGAQNNTIKNNTISLNRNYQNTFGIYSNDAHSSTNITNSGGEISAASGANTNLKFYSNTISNVNIGIAVVGAPAFLGTGLDIGGSSVAMANNISNYGTTGSFSSYRRVSADVNGILVTNEIGANVSYNTIASSNGGTLTGMLRGIFVGINGAPTYSGSANTTTINNNSISLKIGAATGAMEGIRNDFGSTSSATVLNINNNDFNNFTHTGASPSGTVTFAVNSASTLSQNINSNTFTNITLNTTGSTTFISNSVSAQTGGVKNVNGNNIVTAFNKTGAGGTVTLYNDNGTSVIGVVITNNGNNFSHITVTGATTIAGWSITDGGQPTKNITNNTFTNWTAGTGAITGFNIASGSSSNTTVTGNNLNNISGAGAITGFALASTIGTAKVSSNTINTLASTGGAAVIGITTAANNSTLSKNKIYDLSGNNVNTTINGILITAGTTVTVANNLIGDLRATAASGTNVIRGISSTSTTTVSTISVFYNTIYLNGTSTGTNFGTSGIFHTMNTTATTAALSLRNNIIVNTSTAKGTGLTVAYRRSGGSANSLANYAGTSDNNLYYAGTPSASNLIYSDGTSSAQTLSDYKNGVFTAGTISPRDGSSVTENPPFLSTSGASASFLHIDPTVPTQIESGAAAIGSIPDDFDGDARNGSTPDIGADEFNGTPPVCNTPAGISVGSITTSSASVSFTCTNCSGSYIVEYGLTGFTPGTGATSGTGGTVVTGASSAIALSSLTANTGYDVYVRQNCGKGNFSGNSPVVPFTTPCNVISSLPWNEGFESLSSVGAGVVPTCWSTEIVSGANFTSASAPVKNGLGARTGTNYVWSRWSSNAWLYTPAFSLTAGTSYDFSYYYRQTDAVAGFTITTAYGNAATSASMTNVLATVTDPVNTGYMQAKYTFTPSVSGTYYFGVHSNAPTASPWYMEFDDFKLEVTPSCAVPTAVSVGSVTPASASVSFTSPGSNLIVELGPSGFTPGVNNIPGIGGTVVTGTTSPIPLNGLLASTSYDVYVRQDCGAGVYSTNSIVAPFITPCNNVTLPVAEGFNTAGSSIFPGCWKQQYVVGTSNILFDSLSANPTTSPFEGTRYVLWNSFEAEWPAGNETRLVSPPITTLGTSSVDVQFQWYNENSTDGWGNNGDGVQVQYSLDGITWVDAGSFIARQDLTLAAGTSQWATKTVTLPAEAGNQALIYVAFKFHSEFGDNCALDAVAVKTTTPCDAPTNVVVTSITQTTASVSFTSAGNNFIVEYGAPGFTPGIGNTAGTGGTIVTGTASPIALTGLTGSTAYDVYVRQVCPGPNYSANTAVTQFMTLCTATNVPYLEDFESLVDPGVPACITVQDLNGVSTWTGFTGDASTASSGSKSIRYNFDPSVPGDDWFFARGLNLTGGTSYRLRFDYKSSDGPAFVEKLQVKYGTAPNAAAMTTGTLFTNSYIDINTGDPFLVGEVDFTPPSTGVYYIGFHCNSDPDQAYLYVDDVSVDVTPACASPTSVTAVATSETSASVSFTSAGTNFIVEYGPPGFTPGTDNTTGAGGTIVTGTSSPIALTGLTGGPSYDIYVRTVCAGPSYSSNSVVDKLLINDEAPGARTLTLGAACTGASETNVGSTKSTGEDTYLSSLLCSGVAQSPIWYKFVAPASGAVRVSTDVGTGGTFNDSKIAIFSASNVTDYSTFGIIACDDDGGSVIGAGFMSVVYATGLTPGATYYVLVDRYDNFAPTGTFCIQADELDNSMVAASSDCSTGIQVPGSNGVTNYKGWVPLLNSNSQLIALARNTNGLDPNTFTNFRENVNVGAVRTDVTSGEKYLDRNFMIDNSSVSTNTDVQFFFLNSELTALKAVDAAATLPQLRVTRQTGTTCQSDFVTINGVNSELAQVGNGTSADGLVKWIQTSTPGFSNFFIHSVRLPVVTSVFLQGAYNAGLARHKDVTTQWATALNTFALNQPYNTTAFGNYNGGESVTAGFFTSTSTPWDVTDWVLLELKDGSNNLVGRRAAFVREDGKIIGIDGDSSIVFPGVETGNYYLTIRHRNHLGISTQNLLPLTAKALGVPTNLNLNFDFRTESDANIFGTSTAYKIIGSNNVLIGGNVVASNVIGSNKVVYSGPGNDPGAILAAVGGIPTGSLGTVAVNVYHLADVTFDGRVIYSGPGNDPAFILQVIGGVPTNSVIEQRR